MQPKKPHLIETITLNVAPEDAWTLITEEVWLNKWWCYSQRKQYSCVTDLRPLGTFRTTMNTNGQIDYFDYVYLEVIPFRRISFTNALRSDLSPSYNYFAETISFDLIPHEYGTRVTADINAKSFPIINAIFNNGSFDIWKYNLSILQTLAAQLQKSISQQTAKAPPVQP
jgi:uncharacterized protein YndB with AHSA1/START domain